MIGFIAVALITGAVLGLLSVFWKDIATFLQKAINKVQEALHRSVEGSTIALQRTRGSEMITEISRHYSRVEQHWHETTIRREVPPSQIPKDILELVKGEELDISERLQLELEQTM